MLGEVRIVTFESNARERRLIRGGFSLWANLFFPKKVVVAIPVVLYDADLRKSERRKQ